MIFLYAPTIADELTYHYLCIKDSFLLEALLMIQIEFVHIKNNKIFINIYMLEIEFFIFFVSHNFFE